MIFHGQLIFTTDYIKIKERKQKILKSEVIKNAQNLYDSGQVQEALEYYATALWHNKENNTELLYTWLEDNSLIEKAGEQAVCTFIASILLIIDHCDASSQNRLWTLCQNIFDHMEICEDREDTSDRYVVECNLYRHQKKPEKALAIILKGLAKGGTTSRYTFAGLTYLDLEEETEAEKYIALGYQSDPNNASAYNDLGDYYFDKRQWKKASNCYYKVLQTDDYNDCNWAEPSWIFCCYMLDPDPYELELLLLFAAANLDNQRAQLLCKMAAMEQLIPNVDYLDTSSESIINLVRNVRENGNTSGVTSCATTCQESASSINAMRLALEEITGKPSHFVVLASKAQNPPLDQTIDEEGIILWNYRDINTPIPTVNQPSEDVKRVVEELASTDFSLPIWYESAKKYVAMLSESQYNELYGVMVYPPHQTIYQYPAEDWLFRVQFAAVCILAQISLHEIDKICKGQLDWPIIPAFTLAAWLATQDTSYISWAEKILNLIKSRISQENYCFFEHAFTCAAYLLPGKDKKYYTHLWLWRQSIES